jgi:2,4-dienoyl-CoA reductase-like NADH-dependent reductase (Old Yellow Enzyme family)/thioredoxin reductase
MNTCPPFRKLFEPGRIGPMEIKNRIVMPAMATGTSTEDGFVTQQTKDYYEERAKGGAGLIIVEFTCIDFPRGKGALRQLAVDDDKFVRGLRDLAQTIQRHGAKVALQLHHAGIVAKRENTGFQPVGASEIARPGGEIPRKLTTEEIGDIVSKFARAAERARDAGFNGIEIHGAHAYLIAQFLSSAWNRRADRYGGSLENRARILLEIFHTVRERVGKSFPVWCRINGEESGIPGGMTLDEAKELAMMIEEAGCDAVSVSASALDLLSSRPHFFPPGWAAHLAAGVKKAIHLPVIGVGRITPEIGERLLQKGKVDFIAMGRALRADPELPNKLASGKQDDIRPCIVCSACSEYLRPGGHRLCAVNPALGREREYMITPTKERKKVVVVGGGPAGMEAARVAALRGHEVMLCEKGSRLGGKLLLAAAPPFKEEIMKLVDFLSSQIKKLGIRVELETEATSPFLKSYKPDVVVLATGSTPLIPQISGIDRKNVVIAEDVLDHKVEVGSRIAVLGGGQVGCEVAAFLAEKGKKVIVVEMLEVLAADLGKRQGRQFLIDYLTEKGVTLLTQMKGEEISDQGLLVIDKYGQRQIVEVDTVVLACGSIPDKGLFERLKGIAPEIHIAGDCAKTRTILGAIDEAARIARLI